MQHFWMAIVAEAVQKNNLRKMLWRLAAEGSDVHVWINTLVLYWLVFYFQGSIESWMIYFEAGKRMAQGYRFYILILYFDCVDYGIVISCVFWGYFFSEYQVLSLECKSTAWKNWPHNNDTWLYVLTTFDPSTWLQKNYWIYIYKIDEIDLWAAN